MTMARLIDGKASAAKLRADVARQVAALAERHGVTAKYCKHNLIETP